MQNRLPLSRSFFMLLTLSLIMFGASIAYAQNAQDAAYDQRGNFVVDSRGDCVRTKWMEPSDPCAPPPPPPPPPSPAPVKRTPPPPPPAPVIKLEQRTIYFDFDSAELTEKALEKLTYLAQVINQSRAIADVHIVGYADQIGTDSYNLALSKARVASVEDFLDQRSRMDTKAADIRGLGEAPDEIECDTLPRKKRIECLQPQRRVEIEFKYQPRLLNRK